MDYPYDLGAFSRKVTTTSPEAQSWFDRGLNWCYGYHHEESIACFEKALTHDPDCAMAHWGIAYAIGPNYNYPWVLHDPAGKAAALARAFDASRAALALAARVTRPERTLIEALATRYPQRDPIEDQRPWDRAFAAAMRAAHQAQTRDLDIRAIFVEAVLNCTPWQMWNVRTGEPTPGANTLEVRDVLESAFRTIPGAMDHPGLLHLHVHLMEMSPTPEAALLTGDRLRELTPDMGHLVHMPTHIDIQCGHYRDTMHWNQKAMIADRKYYDRAGPLNFYTGYRIHNYHFAAYGAMYLGQFAPALAAVDEMLTTMPESLLRIPSPPMADFFEGYISIRQHVLVRFGKWHDIIAQPLPADPALYCNTTAMIHYAKGVAHAALGQVPAAEAEQTLFREAAQRVPKSRYMHNVCCQQALAVAEEMLEGEIAYRRGEHDRAFATCAPPSRSKTTCPTTSPGAGCNPSATPSAPSSSNKAASPKPKPPTAKTSASPAPCPAPRSTRTTSGPCAACSIASKPAARSPNPPSSANAWPTPRRAPTSKYPSRASAPLRDRIHAANKEVFFL